MRKREKRKKRGRKKQTFSGDCPTNRDIIESGISICVRVYIFLSYTRSPLFPSSDSFCLLSRLDLTSISYLLSECRRESVALERSRREFSIGLPATIWGFDCIRKEECTLVPRCCIETRYGGKYKRAID